jgi:hypothetical protein
MEVPEVQQAILQRNITLQQVRQRVDMFVQMDIPHLIMHVIKIVKLQQAMDIVFQRQIEELRLQH